MSTPFTPCICECPTCKRLFVEWWLTTELASKPPGRTKRCKCDICYGDNASKEQRQEIITLCLKRRIQCHVLYFRDCDKSHLDVGTREYLKRGPDAYSAHTPLDSGERLLKASHSSPDRTSG